MKTKFKQDSGQAGLTILLSLIVMLFIIGLVVMIFSLMGSELSIATYTASSGSVTNETITALNDSAGDLLSVSTLRDASCTAVVVTNATSKAIVPASNYTITGCLITGALTSAYINENVNVTYTYTYNADNTATDTINDTTSAVAGVTDWFDIFVVIGAMIVLILLTVIIITAIRSSGMIAGSTKGVNNVGTA